MEDIAWKKDETPYIVFSCSKCHQYTYVKTTRKTKKCARCGRINNIPNISGMGELVIGISSAVELVKKKQEKLAIKELGTHPEFRTFNDFKVAQSLENLEISHENTDEDLKYQTRFKEMLIKLSMMYKSFPYYIIEIMAENYDIPNSEIKLLTRSFRKQGILIRQKDSSYCLSI
jgi:hypothetical protein